MGNADEFMKLLREGKLTEARAMLEAERPKAKFAPTEIIIQERGRAVLKCRGKLVVPDKNGNWKLKNPTRPRSKKTHRKRTS